jgi:molybdenum cofactor cytidylyltransferase
MTSPRHMAGVLLAAGKSERHGGNNKLLAPLAGKPMIGHVIAAMAKSQCDSLTIILGYEAEEIASLCENTPFRHIVNTNYDQGMGTSIALAVEARQDHVTDMMIVLGDMPLITPAILDQLLSHHLTARYPNSTITIPIAEGRQGNPVIWGSDFFPALSDLQGDQGGKALIKAHADAINSLEIEHPAVLTDADTLSALAEIEDMMIMHQAIRL